MAYPVLISVYTRLKHLQNCVESLSKNELAKETDLFVVSDAPRYLHHTEGVERVREYVRSIQGFKSVRLFDWSENKGSTESIRAARMAIFEKYDAQIFMEDDNVVSPLFLEFMNDALAKYTDNDAVFGVCGFNFDVGQPLDYPFDAFFMDVISANGWGYWKEKYLRFFNQYQLPDFKGKPYKVWEKHCPKPANNLKRMAKQGVVWGDTKITHYLYEQRMVCLYPCVSLVQDTGWDGSGEHCGNNADFANQELNTTKPIRLFPSETSIDPSWAKLFKNYFSYPFMGKYKTALFDLKVELKKRMRR